VERKALPRGRLLNMIAITVSCVAAITVSVLHAYCNTDNTHAAPPPECTLLSVLHPRTPCQTCPYMPLISKPRCTIISKHPSSNILFFSVNLAGIHVQLVKSSLCTYSVLDSSISDLLREKKHIMDHTESW
jgi:hypothetical protein